MIIQKVTLAAPTVIPAVEEKTFDSALPVSMKIEKITATTGRATFVFQKVRTVDDKVQYLMNNTGMIEVSCDIHKEDQEFAEALLALFACAVKIGKTQNKL